MNYIQKKVRGTDPYEFQFLKEIGQVKMIIVFFYLYSVPTVAEFFDGIDATLAIKPFNSPIAFPGFKPYTNKCKSIILIGLFLLSYFWTNFCTIHNCMTTIQ